MAMRLSAHRGRRMVLATLVPACALIAFSVIEVRISPHGVAGATAGPKPTGQIASWDMAAWLDHWQALLAGVLGFGAAIVVVAFTLRSERRRADRDLEALRRSLGIEVRQSLGAASTTFRLLAKLAQTKGTITSRMWRGSRTIQSSGRKCARCCGPTSSERLRTSEPARRCSIVPRAAS
jgi:hypothetical protein